MRMRHKPWAQPELDASSIYIRNPHDFYGKWQSAFEKEQVRELAAGYGIPVAEKPDSMEICFIPDGDYAAWLDRRGNTPPFRRDFKRSGRGKQ